MCVFDLSKFILKLRIHILHDSLLELVDRLPLLFLIVLVGGNFADCRL